MCIMVIGSATAMICYKGDPLGSMALDESYAGTEHDR